jgi:hypothetical protein
MESDVNTYMTVSNKNLRHTCICNLLINLFNMSDLYCLTDYEFEFITETKILLLCQHIGGLLYNLH